MLSVFLILFLSLFALDVFVPGETILNMIVGFAIHLIPNFVILAVLIFSWKKEMAGGILFIALAVFFIFFFHAYKNLATFLVVPAPLIVIGLLFLLSSRYNKLRKEKENS